MPLGPAEQGSSPLLSPVLSDAGGAGMDYEEPRHKVGPSRLEKLAEGCRVDGPVLTVPWGDAGGDPGVGQGRALHSQPPYQRPEQRGGAGPPSLAKPS